MTGRIYEDIKIELPNVDIYLDVNSIPAGVNFKKHIYNSIKKSDLVLAIIGSEWLGNSTSKRNRIFEDGDWIKEEMLTSNKLNIPIIPILINNAELPSANDIPNSLRFLLDLNSFRLRGYPDYRNDLKNLIEDLDKNHKLKKNYAYAKYITLIIFIIVCYLSYFEINKNISYLLKLPDGVFHNGENRDDNKNHKSQIELEHERLSDFIDSIE